MALKDTKRALRRRHIPLFPICRYRVTKHEEDSTPFSTPYTIHEKIPVRLKEVARIYGIGVAILLGIIGLGYLMFR